MKDELFNETTYIYNLKYSHTSYNNIITKIIIRKKSILNADKKEKINFFKLMVYEH